MKRTNDPLLYELRRSRAASNKRERATRPSPPDSAPDDRTSPPEPVAPVSEPEETDLAPPEAPPPVEKNVSLKTTENVDEPVVVAPIIEANDDERSGLDWMLRRK